MNKLPRIKEIISVSKAPVSAKPSFAEKFVKSTKLKYLSDKPISLPIRSRMGVRMRYTKTRADILDAWSWGHQRKWDSDTWRDIIFPHISSSRAKNWSEIESETAGKRRRNKAYNISAICAEAQRRLIDIQLEDLDEVFRFRVGSLSRLYGFRIAEVFLILWWDPKHNICPTKGD